MSRLTRKWIALLLLFWMPLSGAGVLATSVSMQAGQGACHESAMPAMSHGDSGASHHSDSVAAQDPQADENSGNICSNCGVCHLACSVYLSVPDIVALAQHSTLSNTPYLFTFHSVISTPLVPPPLARV
ncbi:MAG: DUF2946 domain-containing protein [Gallionella sp.]|jgi:hypothetical protein|nr:DUF2946 domain-containing protein [Gallionella sp.]